MYSIMGGYHGETEEIDTADSEEEAIRLSGEYSYAFGPGWDIWYKKA